MSDAAAAFMGLGLVLLVILAFAAMHAFRDWLRH
jgi:hypothetical protein